MMIGEVWLTHQMVPDLCAELGVHRSTVARWLDKRKLPRTVEVLLDITHNGNLGRIHPSWNDWNIDVKSGELVTPIVQRGNRRTYRHVDILKIQLTYQQLSCLKSSNTELLAKVASQNTAIRKLHSRVSEQQRLIERLSSRLAMIAAGEIDRPVDANRPGAELLRKIGGTMI